MKQFTDVGQVVGVWEPTKAFWFSGVDIEVDRSLRGGVHCLL